MGSRALETAIGLVLVYLLFSLFCTAINEWIARLLALRATGLRKGINELLANGKESGLAEAFHRHPLIEALKPDKAPILRRVSAAEKAKYPSYISAQTFALTVMDLAMVVWPSTGDSAAASLTRASATLRTDLGNDLPAPLRSLLEDVNGDAFLDRARVEDGFN